MNKYIYLILSFLLIGCTNGNQEFTLKGKIQGLESDTILAVYQLPEYKLDTITTIESEFKYTFTPDTFTVFTLIFNKTKEYPIFANKGEKVEIEGNINDLKVKGKGENKLFTQITQVLENTPASTIKDKVDSIIQKNNHSFTNLFLIDKYFVQDSLTSDNKIEELINSQIGIIKDTPYMTDLQNKLKNQKLQSVYALNNKDRNGENFKWNTIKNKYVLIDFWASWHPQSLIEQDSLQRVVKDLHKENFTIVSISLDYDKEAWLKASDRDTTQWVQLCDFKGWENTLIKDQGITNLPSNLLLNKDKRIIDRDIRGQELIDKIKQLLKEDKEREKRKKKR
ncbi:MAG: DUF4369 domain-containing protein [Bacteroides sp]|nr:DUF4369 domain-containing protein [Bacteroides sp.]